MKVYPTSYDKSSGNDKDTKLQTRLIRKLGETAFPFSIEFPDLAPNSVVICGDDNEDPSAVSQLSNDLY